MRREREEERGELGERKRGRITCEGDVEREAGRAVGVVELDGVVLLEWISLVEPANGA